MENDSALKFELSAAGLWKLHSHQLGSSDSDRRTTSTTLKKKEQKKPREKVSATHSSNICPSEKLKFILSYLMSLSLMKRLIWAFVAFFTASLESWFYPGNEIKCIEQSPDWRTRAKLYNDEENSFKEVVWCKLFFSFQFCIALQNDKRKSLKILQKYQTNYFWKSIVTMFCRRE